MYKNGGWRIKACFEEKMHCFTTAEGEEERAGYCKLRESMRYGGSKGKVWLDACYLCCRYYNEFISLPISSFILNTPLKAVIASLSPQHLIFFSYLALNTQDVHDYSIEESNYHFIVLLDLWRVGIVQCLVIVINKINELVRDHAHTDTYAHQLQCR